MNMNEVRQRAKEAGLSKISRLNKGDLIRSIQSAEGNQPCFNAEWRMDCQQTDCCWMRDCLR